MKATLVLLAVFGVLSAWGNPVNELKRDSYERFIQFPDGDGIPHTVDLDAEPDVVLLNDITRNPSNNLYLLYTRKNPSEPQILEYNDVNSIRSSNFSPDAPTLVIAHGWLSNQNTGINALIRDACFTYTDNMNVIVLDWRRLARADYVTAVLGVPAVGRGLGQFLYFLHLNFGASLENMHLVGFSLGAHLVGNAGRQLSGRVGRITALDPAGPLWNLNSNSVRESDAIYVEGVHTNGGVAGLGIGNEVGHADFFVNGGNSQPGCLTPICDHNRAWEYFASSIKYDHLIGHQCSSNLQITMNNCKGSRFYMGNANVRKWGTGKYRVNTSRRYPF